MAVARKHVPGTVTPVHKAKCPAKPKGSKKACMCSPSFRAQLMRNGRRLGKTFTSRQAAEAWLADAGDDLARESATDMTVERAWQVLEPLMRSGAVLSSKKEPYSVTTVNGMASRMKTHILPAFHGMLLSEVQEHHVRDLRDRLMTEPSKKGKQRGPSTARGVLSDVSLLWQFAIDRKLTHVDPSVKVVRPSATAMRTGIVSVDEARRMLEVIAAQHPADHVMWCLAMYAGLRRSEAAGLCWGEVDLEAGVITIERTYHLGVDENVAAAERTKTGSGKDREVPIPQTLVDVLLAHRPDGWKKEDRVCALPTHNWSRFLRRARKAWTAEDLPVICFHEGRHAYVSFLLAACAASGEAANVRELMTYTGHSSYDVFIRTYAKILPNSHQAARKRFQALLDTKDDEGGAGTTAAV